VYLPVTVKEYSGIVHHPSSYFAPGSICICRGCCEDLHREDCGF